MVDMAYSDSTLKRWLWHGEGGRWELLAAGNYLTSCLTHTFRLGGAEERALFTTATDGHIAAWTPAASALESGEGGALVWTRRHKIHQSAVLAIVHIGNRPGDDDGTAIIITGGDDNAIAITRLNGTDATPRTLLLPRAHAAAVTGLATIPRQGPSTYWLISASIDQRVKLWRVDVDTTQPGVEGVDARLVHDVFTSVADVSALALYPLEDGAQATAGEHIEDAHGRWILRSRTRKVS